ncbi:flagellin [Maricaulis sp. CAU 1757]
MASVNDALRHLSGVFRERVDLNNRVATGLKVASASDDGAVWAMAQGLRVDNVGREAALGAIDMASGVVEIAIAAAEGISDLMIDMREKLVAASDTTLDEGSWRALMEEFVALGEQTQTLVANARFNDQNLLEAGADDLSVMVSKTPGQVITISAEDLTDGGGIFNGTLPTDFPGVDASALTDRPDSTMIAAFDQSISDVNAALSRLAVGRKAMDVQRELVVTQINVTERGIGTLIDADLGRAAAKLEALGVQEELGRQALSIANQRPRIILNFFQ